MAFDDIPRPFLDLSVFQAPDIRRSYALLMKESWFMLVWFHSSTRLFVYQTFCIKTTQGSPSSPVHSLYTVSNQSISYKILQLTISIGTIRFMGLSDYTFLRRSGVAVAENIRELLKVLGAYIWLRYMEVHQVRHRLLSIRTWIAPDKLAMGISRIAPPLAGSTFKDGPSSRSPSPLCSLPGPKITKITWCYVLLSWI